MFIARIRPFLQLCRFHRPIGIWLLMLPCWWGVALASPPFHISDLILFLIGAAAMRAAGCVVNDLTDQKFDQAVERTRSRPLVTKEISQGQAILCFLCLCLIGLLVFSFLTFPAKTVSLVAFCLLLIYPWMKRITYWPQLVLGFAFNSGVLIAWANGGKSLNDFLPWLFFSVGILWTLLYDTVYAFQDIQDDLKIGVKSTATLFQDTPKYLPYICLASIMIALVGVGVFKGWSLYYFILIGCVIFYEFYLLKKWDPNSPVSSLKCFKSNQWIGLLLFLALLEWKRPLGVFESPPFGFNTNIEVSACYGRFNGKYLLLQRSELVRQPHVWGVPGGKVEKGETHFWAAVREFSEETQIALKPENLVFFKTFYIKDPYCDFVFHAYIYDFAIEPKVIITKREHQAFAWKTFEEVLNLPLIWGEDVVFKILHKPKKN
ncbi:MAG: 4-hydroxybenzoate octaprenyltransferase [Alphaproteobacteria bacterium]|nr:4-hydroxybenzoate octaprenyltransferase [Alphaproteobacteria bacterium]